jgi:hypothetical protein
VHVAQGRREAVYDEVRGGSMQLLIREESPMFGANVSSTSWLGPMRFIVPEFSRGAAALFSISSNVLPSNTLIS